MSASILAAARAEALFLAPVSRDAKLNREQVTALIRGSVLTHHGVRGVSADVAAEYGDHPDTAAERMTWALTVVTALYTRPRPKRIKVWACEHCRRHPATLFDTYTHDVVCTTCYPDMDTPYCMEFLLTYIPDDVPDWPGRPTVTVLAR